MDEHYENYLRYKAKLRAEPKPFTAAQQRTPLTYMPYAHYPLVPKEES